MAADRRIVGYRRELEGVKSCALCVVASTLRYHKANLMPIHPACDCQPVPLYSDEESDWRREADAQLAAAHQAIADRFGKSSPAARVIPGTMNSKDGTLLYRDAIIVHDHGEIGPVLAVRGQPFTGPSAVGDGKPPRPAPKPKAPAGRTPAQVQAELTALERNLPNLKTDQQRAYTRERIDLLRKQLG